MDCEREYDVRIQQVAIEIIIEKKKVKNVEKVIADERRDRLEVEVRGERSQKG
jgi:hypothetical protein